MRFRALTEGIREVTLGGTDGPLSRAGGKGKLYPGRDNVYRSLHLRDLAGSHDSVHVADVALRARQRGGARCSGGHRYENKRLPGCCDLPAAFSGPGVRVGSPAALRELVLPVAADAGASSAGKLGKPRNGSLHALRDRSAFAAVGAEPSACC